MKKKIFLDYFLTGAAIKKFFYDLKSNDPIATTTDYGTF